MKLTNILIAVCLLASVFTVAACKPSADASSDSVPSSAVQSAESYKLNYSSKTINKYEYFQLTLLGTESVPDWKSADESIVTVENGLIFGVSKGNTAVTAILDGKEYVCKVSVGELALKPTVKVDLVYDCVDMTVGAEYTLLPYISYGAQAYEDADFTFEVENSAVAEVGRDGKITAKSAGETNICVTAVWRGAEAMYCDVKVVVR